MSNQPQTPYIGSKISLISMLDIRYEGILYQVNSEESTIALSKVCSFGTEDRPSVHPVPARDDVYDYIIFKASDIKDLVVCESPKPSNGPAYDPAIISVSFNNPQSSPKKETKETAVSSKPTDEVPKWSQQTQKQPTNNNQAQGGLVRSRRTTDSGGELGQQQVQQDIGDFNSNYRQRHHAQNAHFNRNNDNNNENRHQNNSNNNYNKSNRNNRNYHNQNNGFQNIQQRDRFKFDNDFDFEKANERFKEQLGVVAENLSNVKIQAEENVESSIKSGSSSIQNENINESFYNKSTSFFDSISCEALEKNEGKANRPDWKKERMTNQETFGHSAVRSLAYRRGQRGSAQNNRPQNNNYQQQNYGNYQNGNNYQRRNFHQNNNQQRQNFNTGSNNNNSGYRHKNNNQQRLNYGNQNYHGSVYSNQNYHGNNRRYNQQNRANEEL